MPKIRKMLVRIVVLAVVLIIAALVILKFYLGGVIAAAAGSVAGVETKVDSASLSILSGKIVIEGLEMKNPEGYSTPDLFKLKRCEVDADLSSLFSDTIVVKKIVLDSMETTIESKRGKYNFQVIIDRLQKGRKEEEEKKEAGRPGKSFRVNLIEITNPQANVHIIGGAVLPVRPGDIRLENLGADQQKPVMIADILEQVLLSMCTAAVNMGGDLIPEEQREAMQKGIDEVGGIVKEAGSGAGKLLEKLGKPLFGKDEEKEKAE